MKVKSSQFISCTSTRIYEASCRHRRLLTAYTDSRILQVISLDLDMVFAVSQAILASLVMKKRIKPLNLHWTYSISPSVTPYPLLYC